MLGDSYLQTLASPNFDSVIASAFEGFGASNTSPDESLVRLDDTGRQTLLHTFPVFFGPSGIEAVASDDLTHVFANAPEAIDPSHVVGTSNVYDLGSGTPALMSRMPVTDLAPVCGVPVGSGAPGGFADVFGSVTQHWVSVDGSRAFFETQGDICSDPVNLYLRDIGAGTTTRVSAPIVAGDADNGVSFFLQASADGSQAIYETATSLDPADDVDDDSNDVDVYRWTAADGNECLTCSIPNANVEPPLFFPINATASEDLSHVYFTSERQFAGAPAPGDGFNTNLYVWHDGTVGYVSPSNGLGGRSVFGTDITPDGNVLVFTSASPLLDAVSGASNGGFLEYYRYDDHTGHVTCISCPGSGLPTTHVPLVLATGTQAVQADVHAITKDGSMVFFATSDSLVPQDVNHDLDIYEWHDGQLGLITNGRTQYPPNVGPSIDTVSPDGRDLLFDDTARLTPDATDSARKLYDARIDGGFVPPPPPTPPCQGPQCRGVLSGAPLLRDPSSASLVGTGNLRPRRATFTVERITGVQRVRLARTGVLTLLVRVRQRGRVSVHARTRLGGHARSVGHAAAMAHDAGVVKLRLRLSGAARRQLARHDRLKLILTVRCSGVVAGRRITLSFVPISGGGRR